MIDNLPNGWKIEKLGNIGDIKAGGTPSRNKSEYWDGKIPWLKISDLKSKYIYNATEFITEEGLNNSSTKLFEKNTILYTIFATLGEVSILKSEATTNQAIAGIKLKKTNINLEYIYYYLLSIKEKIINIGRGVAQNNINLSILRDLNIPIPPLQQQEKIVKVFDLTSNLIEKQKELLEKYDLFLKSKFIEMFGDPITNPMGWENDVLSNVCPNKGDFVDGPFGSDLKVSDRTDEGIRIIQINNVGENEFRDKNKAFIRQEKYLTLKRHEVLQNDIIIAKMGEPIARSCFLPKHIDKAIIVADCMRMRITNNDYNRVFICFYLNFYTTKVLIDNLSHGSTRTRINLSILKTLEIIKPKVELQNKFALIVEKIETIKEKENQKLKQFEDLHNSMMNKAFKGEIK
ncbi:restriction endonuclease subunit S [Aliarcobacter butzleri]